MQSSSYNAHRIMMVYATTTEATLQNDAVNDGVLFLLKPHSFTASKSRGLD